jgi:hypothetical protein
MNNYFINFDAFLLPAVGIKDRGFEFYRPAKEIEGLRSNGLKPFFFFWILA